MLNCAKGLWIFTVLFCGICSATQDLALNFAERFFDAANYESAITEYKRFIFFNPQSDSTNYAYYKIALAYRNQGKWNESIDALHQAVQTAPNDSIRNEREIALAIVLIASRDYSGAEFQLLKIESFSPFISLKRRASFFRGIANIYSFKWQDARNAFQNYYKDDTSAGLFNVYLRIDSLLFVAQHVKYKSPKLANILSTILPGSGQIYIGDWRNGINALTVNGVVGYFLVNSLIRGNYQDALISYIPLLQRYYLGNRFHAERLAVEYNDQLNRQYLKHILEFILNE